MFATAARIACSVAFGRADPAGGPLTALRSVADMSLPCLAKSWLHAGMLCVVSCSSCHT